MPLAPETSCSRSAAMRARSSAAFLKWRAIATGSRERMPSRRSSSSHCRLCFSVGLTAHLPSPSGIGGPPPAIEHSPSPAANACLRRIPVRMGSRIVPHLPRKPAPQGRMDRNELRRYSCQQLVRNWPVWIGRQAQALRQPGCNDELAISRLGCWRKASAEQRDLLLCEK